MWFGHGDMPAQMRKVNFGAGPAALPESVLRAFADDLIDFEGSGVGIGELSHRTELFEGGVLSVANCNLLKLAGYQPDDWQVLWMTGGGTGQFAAVPLNFDFSNGQKAVYLVTGTWSEKAAEEAKKIIGAECITVIDLRKIVNAGELLSGLRDPEEWISKEQFGNVNYVYYCDNETVDGLELPDANYFETLLSGVLDGSETVFVVDASSNFMSRPLPRAEGRTAVIFAGVQKNLGAAGVTAVLIKKETLLSRKISPKSHCPSVLDYKLTAKNNSLLNTPPVLAIHMCNLVLKQLMERFGDLEAVDAFSREKSAALYKAIEESGRFYCPVVEGFRSRMNVVFKGRGGEGDEAELLKAAEERGMIQLKGHRSVGGLRASLYNAVTLESVHKLAKIILIANELSNESGAKAKDVIQGPGAKVGTIGSDYEQAVGVERLELLSKLAGRSVFSSSEVLCHPRGEGFKGTLSDPVLVETLARSGDAVEAMERIVGCSGVPKGSHEIGFFWVKSETEAARCPECGQAFKLKPILN